MSDDILNAAGAGTEYEAALRRVQKLLAIAEDERGNPGERANAAAMAERTMRKFQIDNAAIIAAELRSKGGAIVHNHVFASMKRDDPNRTILANNPKWGQYIAVALARLNDCEVRQGRGKDKWGKFTAALVFYGYKADVQVCVWMFDFLVGCLIKDMAAWQKGMSRSKNESNSYRTGYVATITARIYQEVKLKDVELLERATSRELVVVKKQAIEEEFGTFTYNEAKRAKVRDAEAFRAGIEQGKRVDLNRRGIGADGSSGPALLK